MRERGRDFRRSKRTLRRNAAWIGLASGGTRIPCVLWDVSDTGARIAAPRSRSLPPAFSLLLAKDGSVQRLCRVVWRNDKQVGVRFINGTLEDLESEASLRQPAMVQTRGDTPSLLMPGYGPHFLEKPERRGMPLSYLAAGMMAVLTASTAVLLVAGMQGGLDAQWALDVCAGAANFCKHPEWTGGAGALMAVVYLAVRGMEG